MLDITSIEYKIYFYGSSKFDIVSQIKKYYH